MKRQRPRSPCDACELATARAAHKEVDRVSSAIQLSRSLPLVRRSTGNEATAWRLSRDAPQSFLHLLPAIAQSSTERRKFAARDLATAR